MPLSQQDEQVRRDVRYRTGRWFFGRRGQHQWAQFWFVLPSRFRGGSCLRPWAGTTCRGARTCSPSSRCSQPRVAPSDDFEVAGAKETLLSRVSSREECERALELLVSRGACTPPPS
jgi:hypothetical protein